MLDRLGGKKGKTLCHRITADLPGSVAGMTNFPLDVDHPLRPGLLAVLLQNELLLGDNVEEGGEGVLSLPLTDKAASRGIFT